MIPHSGQIFRSQVFQVCHSLSELVVELREDARKKLLGCEKSLDLPWIELPLDEASRKRSDLEGDGSLDELRFLPVPP
jgi:hypothetical protein